MTTTHKSPLSAETIARFDRLEALTDTIPTTDAAAEAFGLLWKIRLELVGTTTQLESYRDSCLQEMRATSKGR